MTAQTLLTARQVSERYGIAEQTLANWRWQKTGPPYVKLSNLVKYPVSALEQWVNEGARAA